MGHRTVFWPRVAPCHPAIVAPLSTDTELHEIMAKLDELPQWQGRTFVIVSILTKILGMLGHGLDTVR